MILFTYLDNIYLEMRTKKFLSVVDNQLFLYNREVNAKWIYKKNEMLQWEGWHIFPFLILFHHY